MLDNGRAATQALTARADQNYTLNYTMQDADGDHDTATLTITINGANDTPTVTVNQRQWRRQRPRCWRRG